jgi:hypothetical protein
MMRGRDRLSSKECNSSEWPREDQPVDTVEANLRASVNGNHLPRSSATTFSEGQVQDQ